MKLQVGDKVTVDPFAFDEQIGQVINPEEVLEVIEVNNNAPKGSSGQWVKLKGKITSIYHHSGEEYNELKGDNWIDSLWCSKVDTGER